MDKGRSHLLYSLVYSLRSRCQFGGEGNVYKMGLDMGRFRHVVSIFNYTLQVKFKGFLYKLEGLLNAIARSHTPRHIRSIRTVAVLSFFNYYQISRHCYFSFICACSYTRFNVPIGNSALG